MLFPPSVPTSFLPLFLTLSPLPTVLSAPIGDGPFTPQDGVPSVGSQPGIPSGLTLNLYTDDRCNSFDSKLALNYGLEYTSTKGINSCQVNRTLTSQEQLDFSFFNDAIVTDKRCGSWLGSLGGSGKGLFQPPAWPTCIWFDSKTSSPYRPIKCIRLRLD